MFPFQIIAFLNFINSISVYDFCHLTSSLLIDSLLVTIFAELQTCKIYLRFFSNWCEVVLVLLLILLVLLVLLVILLLVLVLVVLV